MATVRPKCLQRLPYSYTFLRDPHKVSAPLAPPVSSRVESGTREFFRVV